MAAIDQSPTPNRGEAHQVSFPIYLSGALLTGAAGLDSEISQDGAAFVDCANEAVETPAGSGFYILDLNPAEMDCDIAVVNVKTSTSGAQAPQIILPTFTVPNEEIPTLAQISTAMDDALAGFALDTELLSALLGAIDDSVVDLQSRVPAALVSGRMDASVGAMAANVLTAAAIAADAIGASEIAADAIAEIQSGLATAAALATVAGFVDTEVASILAAVDTEVASILSAVTTILAATDTEIADLVARATDIQARLPAALVSGRIDSSVGAMAAGTVTAAAVATDAFDADALAANAVTEIATGMLAGALAELSAAPGAAPTLGQALQWLYQKSKNVESADDTTATVAKDDGTVIASAAVTAVSGLVTRGKYV